MNIIYCSYNRLAIVMRDRRLSPFPRTLFIPPYRFLLPTTEPVKFHSILHTFQSHPLATSTHFLCGDSIVIQVFSLWFCHFVAAAFPPSGEMLTVSPGFGFFFCSSHPFLGSRRPFLGTVPRRGKKEGPLDPQYVWKMEGGDEDRAAMRAPRGGEMGHARKNGGGKLKRMEWRGKGMAISIKKSGKNEKWIQRFLKRIKAKGGNGAKVGKFDGTFSHANLANKKSGENGIRATSF